MLSRRTSAPIANVTKAKVARRPILAFLLRRYRLRLGLASVFSIVSGIRLDSMHEQRLVIYRLNDLGRQDRGRIICRPAMRKVHHNTIC